MPHGRAPDRRTTYFLEAPLRRPGLVLLPLALGSIVSVAIAWLLPDRYRAAALLRAEWASADEALLLKRDIDLASRREQQVRQRVTDRALVANVVREAQPFGPPGAGDASLDAQVDRLLSDLRLRSMAPSSFALEFVHRDPATAALVPNALARHLVENLDASGSEASTTLKDRLEKARTLLKEKADALATAPPAATSAENADTEIAAPDEDAFAERRAVAASLATARARAERLQLEIGAEKPPGSPLSPETELERMRSALAELRKRYTDEHPDVEKLKGQIARLEASLPPARQEPPSPEAELRATEAEIVELAARLAQLQAATSPRPRAIPAPTVPAADATQQRAVLEHEDARRAYQQLLEEWRAAEEADRRNRVPVARFELMRAAVIPRAPDSGSPVLFALAGALLGLAVGLGAALVAEHRDRSVKGPEDLAKILPVPVLAVLPEARPTGKARRSS